MKIRDRYGLIADVPGDWVPIDECESYPACPECGAGEGDQCNFCVPDEDYAVEVSSFVHKAREEAL